MNEEAAWRHLLSLEPGTAGTVGPLTFDAEGSWSSTVEPDPSAAALLDLFGPLRTRRRFVVGQLGQSIDGRIATESGHSHYINGPEDLRRLHRLRALAQAVVVGAGTVASDDPRLTVRRVDGPSPIRVVLDPTGRLDPTRTVFTDDAAPTLWVRAAEPGAPGDAGEGTSARLPESEEGPGGGATVVTLPASDGRFDPHEVLARLADRGLERVLVEGGGITVSAFLSAGALHRLHLSVAPLLMGSGRPGVTLPPIGTLDEAIRPPVRHFHLGDDVLFELTLRPFGE